VAIGVEQTYRYTRPSTVSTGDGVTGVLLSTSGGIIPAGPAEHPCFFSGFLGNPEQTATAMLAVARVARTRFYVPPGILAAVLRAADPVVGEDVKVTTLDGSVTEKKVPLPERWLKGFAEVQLAGAQMQPVMEMPAGEARRFLRSLPASSGTRTPVMFAAPAGRGARLTSRGGAGTVPLAGPERLRVLEPLLRFAATLLAHSNPDGAGASVWELELRHARMVITLSPEVSRGFSGEGGVLRDLADDQSADDADIVSALLAFEPRVDVEALARSAGLSPDRVRRALGRLGAAGRVGFDCAEGAFFHRELLYDPRALEAMHPRLRDARALLEQDAVRADPADPDVTRVRSGDDEHLVRRTATGLRCSCPWYGKHKGTRGPCKHVLAAEIYRRG
jgi:SWIM zinc finger